MRFVADRMLGRLARWLRIIGQDVAYGQQLAGTALVSLARRERRVILTRDTRLISRRALPPHLFVTSDSFREQLRQVVSAFTLEPLAGMLTRCLDCNEELREVERDQARARVPPYVWRTQDRFVACRRCGRIFWRATHLAHMLAELRALGIVPPDDRA